MFRIELDSLKAALVRKAPTRKKYTPRRRMIERVAKRLGVALAAGAALAVVIAANPVSRDTAYAGVIRSSSVNDACVIDVDNTSNATVVKNGNFCVVTVTASTGVVIPSYVSSIGVIVVGGGAGGVADGGAGGGG